MFVCEICRATFPIPTAEKRAAAKAALAAHMKTHVAQEATY